MIRILEPIEDKKDFVRKMVCCTNHRGYIGSPLLLEMPPPNVDANEKGITSH